MRTVRVLLIDGLFMRRTWSRLLYLAAGMVIGLITTIVVVTHDRDVAGSLPRRVTMVDGRVVGDERLVEVRE